MATYLYRCKCLGEIEVTQPMSEDRFENCLQIYERLHQKAPAACLKNNGCSVERLIAGTAGILVKGAQNSCSLGDKAESCGGCCQAASTSGPSCPFG